MTDEQLDQGTAAPGGDTTGGVLSDKAPASSPPADAGHDADHADIDLLDAGEGEEDTDAADPGTQKTTDADADRPAWQRPADLDDDALAEWKEAQGLPVEADGYDINLDLREGEAITETGQQLIEGLKDFAVENDLPPPAVTGLVKWYDAQVKAQQAKLAAADKTQRTETHDVLSERWGSSYDERVEIAKEGARVLPTALRQMLKEARAPDGRRIAHTPELAQALFEIGRLRTRKGNTVPSSDEERLAAIAKVRDANIDEYHRQRLGDEELALMRKRDAKGQTRTSVTLSAAEAAEEAELTQLMSDNIDAYQHRQFRGSGKTGSERLLELRRKRNGAAA